MIIIFVIFIASIFITFIMYKEKEYESAIFYSVTVGVCLAYLLQMLLYK